MMISLEHALAILPNKQKARVINGATGLQREAKV